MEKIEEKLADWFQGKAFTLVAFSGGVDSALVAFLARRFLGRSGMLAVISASPSLKLSDLDDGKDFCLEHDIPLRIIETQELEDPGYYKNPADRCFYCKSALYAELRAIVTAFNGGLLLNGANTDDLGDYRPGLAAAGAFEVRSPLVDCGIDKAGVRQLAAHFQLSCRDKPASPCLSSRIPYGQQITVEKLRQIEAGEALLAEWGFAISRVRHYGKTARIEVPPEQISALSARREELTKRLCLLGFEAVEIDPEGFVSGKLNRDLEPQTS